MTWVPEGWVDVVANTPVDGSVETVNAAAGFANRVNEDAGYFGIRVQEAVRVTNGLRSDAVALIHARLEETLLPGAAALLDSSGATKAALEGYASEVDRIHADARRVAESIDRQLDLIRPEAAVIASIAHEIGVRAVYVWDVGAPATMPILQVRSRPDGRSNDAEIARLVNDHEAAWWRAAMLWQNAIDEIIAARRRWSNLVDERVAAELRLVGSLQETVIGQLIALASGTREQRRNAIALWVSGEMWGIASEPPKPATSHPLLEKLIGQADGSDVWHNPGEPETIAANWAALEEWEREALIAAVPWVIGNLPGLSAGVRDRANRLQVDFYREYPHLLSVLQLRLMSQVQGIIMRAEQQGVPEPPIQLLSLDSTGLVPKIAVVYGDLDTATHTVTVVPGMSSDAADGFAGLDRASLNLLDAQNETLRDRGRGAVVAWLCYDTPDRPPVDWGVISSEYAIEGGRRLAAELDGEYVARALSGQGVPVRTPVVHSYGTTTTTIALTLTRYPVDNLVLIGSAGLDIEIVPSLDALNVDEISPGQKGIYTTHAAGDLIAASGAGLAGRGQPNPDARGLLGLHRFSPVYDGALSFSSDGNFLEGLLRTDGHSLIGEGARAGLFGASASEGHGYLDPRTQSLKTIARISTGMIDAHLAASFTVTEAACVDIYVDQESGIAMPLRVECGE